jgi:hypothetical protein
MYNINPLGQNVLITPAEVIYHAPIDHNFDPRTVQNSIIIAEERWIRTTLGHDLYQEMATEKNVIVDDTNRADLQTHFNDVTLVNGMIVNAYEFLGADNLQLWKKGNLWKLIAECVMVLVIPDGFVKTTTQGVVHPNPPASVMSQSGAVTPDLRSIKWVMDKKMQDRIDPLSQAVKDYICRNKTVYPLYTYCPCEDDCADQNGLKGGTGSKKSQWATGIYDQPQNDCCDGW